MNLQKHHPFGLLAFLHWNHEWNNWHFNEQVLNKALRQLEELGVGFIRMDILWSDVHLGHLMYDFSRYDKLIPFIRQHGIEILAVLQYNKVGRQNNEETWNKPPDSFEEFSAFVAATVQRYKNHIKHWEIWNEPNLSVYWAGPKDGLKRYTRLLKASYEAAKKSDPNCVVMNGGLTEPVVEDVNNFYLQEAREYTDILNIHTFLDPHDQHHADRFDRIIEGVENIMDRHGDHHKKIWITEMGAPGIPSHQTYLGWFGGGPVDEAKQAHWIEIQYKLIEDYPRIEKLFWAFYRDTDNEFKDATDYLGLVRLDLTPKPAFHKFKEIIQNWKKSQEN